MSTREKREERERDLAEVWELIQELETAATKLRQKADRVIQGAQKREEVGLDDRRQGG